MTKILLVITKANFGGAQRYVYDLATSLPRDKFEVEVALGGEGKLKLKLKEAGIPVHNIPGAQRDMNVFKEITALFSLFKIIRKVKPQVIHLNSPKMGALGSLAGRLAGVHKIVYTNHGWPFNEPRGPFQKLAIQIFSWFSVLLTDITIVLSERERRDVAGWPFIKNRIRIVKNGIKPFEMLSRKDALEKLLGAEKTAEIEERQTLVVGSTAELHRNKGLTYAIEGFGQIEEPSQQNTAYIIMGEGEERASLEKLIKQYKLEDRVFLVGSIEDARIYLHALDLFLMPSVKEGLPYALLEAGIAGVPAIATTVGGIPEVITNFQEGLLISPRRPQEIKHALIYIEEHKQDLPIMSATLHKKIVDKYSFDAMLKAVIKIYQGK